MTASLSENLKLEKVQGMRPLAPLSIFPCKRRSRLQGNRENNSAGLFFWKAGSLPFLGELSSSADISALVPGPVRAKRSRAPD